MCYEFTVCMVVTRYDNAEHMKAALLSLTTQTLRPSEILIVDNGGLTDMHYEVIETIGNSILIHLIKTDDLRTVGEGRNIALNAAIFPIVAIADPDDINKPDRFIRLIPELGDKCRMVGAWIREFSSEIDDKNIVRQVPCNFIDIIQYSRFRSPVNNSTICYFKDDALEVGGYNTELHFGEDYDLVMKFIRNGKTIKNIPQIAVNFRLGTINDFYRKRSGFVLLCREIKLHLSFFKARYISLLVFMMIVVIKILIRILPLRLLQLFYIKVLRQYE